MCVHAPQSSAQLLLLLDARSVQFLKIELNRKESENGQENWGGLTALHNH